MRANWRVRTALWSGPKSVLVLRQLARVSRVALCLTLARRLDDRPVHLAGIGVGGIVAQVAALDHPDAFSALPLVGTRSVAPGPVDDDLPDHDAATVRAPDARLARPCCRSGVRRRRRVRFLARGCSCRPRPRSPMRLPRRSPRRCSRFDSSSQSARFLSRRRRMMAQARLRKASWMLSRIPGGCARRNLWRSVMLCSTAHRCVPRPDPWSTPRRAIAG
jgi:pimeloyl-ACP methyl ester carboxylesterase